MWSRRPIATACALTVALTVLLTWPQAAHLTDSFAAHQDPYFSVWRLAWIAHALATSPRHLFDANIYYPSPHTLAFSDATMLQGIVGAPLVWAGVPPVAVYNLMLLGGIALSGVAMFLLARHVTGSVGAALVAAALFTTAPYRVEHFMHLELQWTVWIPMSLLALHRVVERPSWQWGVATGLFLWLELLSCIYYGVFLALAIVIVAALLLASARRRAPAALGWLVVGAMTAGILVIPYAWPYVENMRAMGGRDPRDLAALSAHAVSYLAAPQQNLLWGWTADRFGSMELRLFPGAIALVLAAIGLARGPRRIAWIYAALCAFAFAMSLGVNGPLYRWLYTHIWALGGLRAPSRMAAILLCALAILASFGAAWLERVGAAHGVRPGLLLAIVLALIIVDGWSAPLPLVAVPRDTPAVYRLVNGLDAGAIVELPVPQLDRLPGFDPQYEFWSTTHWKPLVNGYSGYIPPAYVRTLARMKAFPDDSSIETLREAGARYIVVHESLYPTAEELARVLVALGRRADVRPAGRYRDWSAWADVFELR